MVKITAFVLRVFELLFKNYVFTIRTGLAKGLKRRYGFGFKPRSPLTKEEEFLMGLDLEGKTIIDVGGYIGMHAMFFARAVGETGKVITLEPNPRNYEELDHNVRLNNFNNITCMQIGLGKNQERLDLITDPIYPARGSVAKSGAADQRETRVFNVQIFPLDSLVKTDKLPRPDFIKVDVEGFELDVLYGMVETIDTYKPHLFIEIHGETPRKLVELLASKGYSVYHIESGTEITGHNFPVIIGGHLVCEIIDR